MAKALLPMFSHAGNSILVKPVCINAACAIIRHAVKSMLDSPAQPLKAASSTHSMPLGNDQTDMLAHYSKHPIGTLDKLNELGIGIEVKDSQYAKAYGPNEPA